MDDLVVNLSRLQFALTALYHFLFVPLTMGLSLILAIMESVYIMTGKTIWRQMVQFWGILFGINFAMGVATGITMEFQFGTNWAYYSHYVGDIFGTPLAIEGLMAFFLESTFVGLFFFGWDRLSKIQHMVITWLVAIGSNFSALWILIANGWMQNPIGAAFNPQTMRMEMTSFYEVFFNPVAQAKFVHTVSAGYVTGAIFVMAVSAYYILKGKYKEISKRSIAVATSFGLASALSVVVLGDESGYTVSQNQKMKIAAIEAMWETEPAPAGFTLFGFPNRETRTTAYEVKIPWLLGLIATRSFNQEIPGINELILTAQERIRDGLIAYQALQDMKKDYTSDYHKALLEKHGHNMGYALLLKKFVSDPRNANDQQIKAAAEMTIPNVPVLFWSFRCMVGIGIFFILFFGYGFYLTSRRRILQHQWFLKIAVLSLPLPWIAAELGWIVAEYGRQPWAIEGILPTFLGVSSISAAQVWMSLSLFIIFYTSLLVVDIILMLKYIKLGPDSVIWRKS